jgi:hypothetical protein
MFTGLEVENNNNFNLNNVDDINTRILQLQESIHSNFVDVYDQKPQIKKPFWNQIQYNIFTKKLNDFTNNEY